MIRNPRWFVLLAMLAAAGCELPARASADARDRAATHAYRIAEYEFARESAKVLPRAGLANVELFARSVGAECPGALRGAPSGKPAAPIIIELLYAELRALSAPLRPAFDRFAAVTAQLRWDDHTLNHLVHANMALARALLLGPVLPVCADMRGWTASGYTTRPAEPQPSLKVIAEQETETHISQRITRYETRALQRLAQRTQAIDRATSLAYFPRYNRVITQLAATLGLPKRHGALGQLTTPRP